MKTGLSKEFNAWADKMGLYPTGALALAWEAGHDHAARQPVEQEPVSYQTWKPWKNDWVETTKEWYEKHLADGAYPVRALYAAPPAQAVDLGRVRASIQSLLNWIDDWAETPEESGIDSIEAEAEAVLALIDSHGK